MGILFVKLNSLIFLFDPSDTDNKQIGHLLFWKQDGPAYNGACSMQPTYGRRGPTSMAEWSFKF